MQKIDLHQNLINSFKGKLDDFKNQMSDIKDSLGALQGTVKEIKNSGGLEDFKVADLQILGAVIRPFERIFGENDTTTYVVQPSEIMFEENLAAYEELRKQNDIALIKSSDELAETKYMGYKLNFFYKLVGADIIKSLEDVDKMYDKGVRVIQFVDQTNNDLCPCYKTATGGLSELAKDMITHMESKKMIIDVAHMNQESMIEAYRISKRPLLNSHTNIMSIYQEPRNVSDEFLDRVDPSEGLIGLSLNSDLIVGPNAHANIDQFMDQVQYLRDRIGDDQVALGSCYHSFSYQKMVQGLETVDKLKLLEEKMTEKFGDKFTNRFFRENAYRFLLDNL